MDETVIGPQFQHSNVEWFRAWLRNSVDVPAARRPGIGLIEEHLEVFEVDGFDEVGVEAGLL